MIWIGNHVSVSGGFLKMGLREQELGGNTFAFFLRSPLGGRAASVDPGDAAALRQFLADHTFGPLVAHAPYTMNLCAAKEEIREKAGAMLADDLDRMDTFLPGNFYNFHPGCHVGQGVETGVGVIADALNANLRDDRKTTVLLETMAGKGSEIGGCFDTCHVWDAGYDLDGSLDDVLTEFDKVIGLDRLRAVHLNDSKNPCGAHKDRHEQLGNGFIGLPALKRVVLHPALQNRPFILETPNDTAGWQAEIRTVRSFFE